MEHWDLSLNEGLEGTINDLQAHTSRCLLAIDTIEVEYMLALKTLISVCVTFFRNTRRVRLCLLAPPHREDWFLLTVQKSCPCFCCRRPSGGSSSLSALPCSAACSRPWSVEVFSGNCSVNSVSLICLRLVSVVFQEVVLSCNVQGPVVFVQSTQMDFGEIPVLTDVTRALHLSNQSTIPAHFTARMVQTQQHRHTRCIKHNRAHRTHIKIEIIKVTWRALGSRGMMLQ